MALEVGAESLRERLADAEARVRMGRLFGEALNIREAVGSLNYGNAQPLSSTFLDGARAEASITSVAAFKTTLEAVLQARDQLTAALARGDQAALEPLPTWRIPESAALEGAPLSTAWLDHAWAPRQVTATRYRDQLRRAYGQPCPITFGSGAATGELMKVSNAPRKSATAPIDPPLELNTDT